MHLKAWWTSNWSVLVHNLKDFRVLLTSPHTVLILYFTMFPLYILDRAPSLFFFQTHRIFLHRKKKRPDVRSAMALFPNETRHVRETGMPINTDEVIKKGKRLYSGNLWYPGVNINS
jgi:hypothetical protein